MTTAPSPEAATRAPLIWVVEDSAQDFAVVERAMDRSGPARLVHWTRAEQALAEVEAGGAPEPPDLLIVDLNLPGIDGAELIRRIRAQTDPAWAQLPICVLSSSDRPADVLRCREAGADGYRIKPRRSAELAELAAFTRALAAGTER